MNTYLAYAKINLLLDVTGKRPDCYHNVAMIMQTISLHDVVTVEKIPGSEIEICCDQPGIPTDCRNIAWRAAKAFGQEYGPPDGLRISIEKHIPSQAGLGGGSADAAAVLRALRDMYAPTMPDEKLISIGVRVGADVPFCIVGGCCLCEGIGEVLTPLPCLPNEYTIEVYKPRAGVSTKQAYTAMDSIELLHPDTALAVDCVRKNDWDALFPLCGNVFEQAVHLPDLAEYKRDRLQRGALMAQLTGSGSAMFPIWNKRGTEMPAQNEINRRFLCSPTSSNCSTATNCTTTTFSRR